MDNNPDVKFAKIDGKLENILEKLRHIDTTLEKDYVTNDQLTIKLANLELMRKIVVWLTAVVSLEIIGIIFYVIQRTLLR